MLRALPDQRIVIVNCSLTNALAESLEGDLEWFRVPSKMIRADILDCYLVEQVCPEICKVERLTRFSENNLSIIPVIRNASGESFNTEKGIAALKAAVVGADLSSKPSAILLATTVGAGATAGGVAAPIAVTGAVAAAGFSSTGIVAGSTAASMMSASAIASGGGVASGSVVAISQSIGAVGLAGGPLAFAIAGGVVVVGGATAGIFFGAKAIHKKIGDDKRKPGGKVHHCLACDDRKL